tara:strand:- start:607 stop:810 length:204 start_codon:yes stop_codon:yes gene_type:complete
MPDLFGDPYWCWVTGENIPEDEMKNARFTSGWDCWVSKEGQEILEKSNKNGTINKNPEWVFIWKEWN